MKILFQMARGDRFVVAYLGAKSGDKAVKALFEVIQSMAHQQQDYVSASPALMTNLQRLVLYSAYHMDYYDDDGNLIDKHDVYLDVPLEHEFSQHEVDCSHLSQALIQLFEVVTTSGSITDGGQFDPVFLESLLGTLGAMHPQGNELKTLSIQLVDDEELPQLTKD